MRPRNKTYKRKSYKKRSYRKNPSRKNKRSKRIKKSRGSFIKKTRTKKSRVKKSRANKYRATKSRNKKSRKRMIGGSGEGSTEIERLKEKFIKKDNSAELSEIIDKKKTQIQRYSGKPEHERWTDKLEQEIKTLSEKETIIKKLQHLLKLGYAESRQLLNACDYDYNNAIHLGLTFILHGMEATQETLESIRAEYNTTTKEGIETIMEALSNRMKIQRAERAEREARAEREKREARAAGAAGAAGNPAIADIMDITKCTKEEAINCLEAADGDLDRAILIFYENPDNR